MGPRSRAIGLLEQAGAPNKVQTGLFEDHKAPGALAFGGPISSCLDSILPNKHSTTLTPQSRLLIFSYVHPIPSLLCSVLNRDEGTACQTHKTDLIY